MFLNAKKWNVSMFIEYLQCAGCFLQHESPLPLFITEQVLLGQAQELPSATKKRWARISTGPPGSRAHVLLTTSATDYIYCLFLTFWKEFLLRGIWLIYHVSRGLLRESLSSGR